MVTTEHGFVAAVTSKLDGDTLAVAATALDTVIYLEDASPFAEDGGSAFIDDGTNSEELVYLSVDLDTDSMTLDVGLTNSYAIETEVTVYPETRTRVAEVRLDDDDDDGLITARVPYSMIPFLPTGIRDQGGESVVVELLRGSWVIRDVLGEEPVVEGASAVDTTPPPVPENVVTLQDKDAVICDWTDPLDVADVDLLDADIKGYQVEIVDGPAAVWTTPLKSWKLRTASRARYVTTHYARRYWFRVRTVDSSGNKSAWVEAGPVRPSRTRMVRREVNGDIEVSNLDLSNAMLPLVTGQGNVARLVSTTDYAVAATECYDANGTLSTRITTGTQAQRTFAGLSFRVVDSANFLAAVLVDSTGFGNALGIGRVTSGSVTILDTALVGQISAETTYDMDVVMDGTDIRVYLDGIERLAITESQGLTETMHGLAARRTATLDNGQSRWDWVRFQPSSTVTQHVWDDAGVTWDDPDVTWDGLEGFTAAADVPVLDDYFDRPAINTLGTADSGTAWSEITGTWGVEKVDTPFALLGSAMVMPIFYIQMTDLIDDFNWPGQSVKLFGAGGAETPGNEAIDPIRLLVDRPTRFLAHATTTVGNRSSSAAYNLRVFVVFREDGNDSIGRASSQYLATDGDPVNKWHSVTVLREYFVDGTPDDPIPVEIAWGFRNEDGVGRNGALRDAKLLVWATYAPDWSSAYTGARRASWTRFGLNRVAYRGTEDNEDI